MATKAKLILGTANMGVKPYGTMKEQMPLNEINRILDYARANGIKTLESSEAYLCDPVLSLNFDLIYKVTHPYNINRVLDNLGRKELLGLLYHHGFDTIQVENIKHPQVHYTGSSVYHKHQIHESDRMVEVSLNIENRKFNDAVYPCKIVRSVFDRGELIQKYGVRACLEFIKSNPTVHGCVVGVDNVAQLKEIIGIWNE